VKANRPNVKETPPPPPATQPADYAGIFSGRVWSGAKAVELGLADQNGMLSDAIDLARQLSNSPSAKAVIYRRPYGYGGSIYAQSPTPQPQANVLQLNLPGADTFLSPGFYYLWQP
jgi:ClpP class serine protease